jgi:hypothetical protein
MTRSSLPPGASNQVMSRIQVAEYQCFQSWFRTLCRTRKTCVVHVIRRVYAFRAVPTTSSIPCRTEIRLPSRYRNFRSRIIHRQMGQGQLRHNKCIVRLPGDYCHKCQISDKLNILNTAKSANPYFAWFYHTNVSQRIYSH